MAIKYNEKNWRQILAINKIIGTFIGQKPEIEYCVGAKDGTSYTYSPKNVGTYFTRPDQQKEESERWVKEQSEKYNNNTYAVIKQEHYPSYERDYNELMKAYDFIEGKMLARTTIKNTALVLTYSVHIVSSAGKAIDVASGLDDNDKRRLRQVFGDNPTIEAQYEHEDRHTALYHALLSFILQVNKAVEEENAKLEGGYHQCPYCSVKCGLINDYFNHIELLHPGKQLL